MNIFLASIMQLSLVFSAAPVQLEITPLLTIDTKYLQQRERAPEEGFFLSRVTMARVITELRQCSASCEARVETIQSNVAGEIQVIQQQNEELLSSYVAQIDMLERGIQDANSRMDEAKSNLKWWRLGSLITTSILLGTTSYLIVRNP